MSTALNLASMTMVRGEARGSSAFDVATGFPSRGSVPSCSAMLASPHSARVPAMSVPRQECKAR